MIQDLALIGIGLFVGMASSIFGIGGGILITPLLPLVVSIPQRETVGTALFCIFVVVGLNTISFMTKGLVEKRISLLYGLLAAFGALSASFYSGFISDLALKVVTSVVLLVNAFNLYRARHSDKGGFVTRFKKHLWPVGFFAGTVSGLSGVGTGVILSPFFMQAQIVSPEKISPTLNAVLTITSLFGFIGYLSQGLEFVRFDLSAWIITGAIVSSHLGRTWQTNMRESTRKTIMAGLVLALALLVLVPLLSSYK